MITHPWRRSAVACTLASAAFLATGCAVVNSFGTTEDRAAGEAAQQAVLSGLGAASFQDACGTVDWACEVDRIGAESAAVVRVESSVTDSRWEPAGRGARAIMEYLRDDPANSAVTVVKFVNADGAVLDTADKVTYRIGDCTLPCGSPNGG